MAGLTDAVRRWEKADAKLSSIEERMVVCADASGVIAKLRRLLAERARSSTWTGLVRLKDEVERACDRRFRDQGLSVAVLTIIDHDARRFSEFADRSRSVAKRYRTDGKLDGISDLLDAMDCLDSASRRSLVGILKGLRGETDREFGSTAVSVAKAFRDCVERGDESLIDPFITFFAAAVRRRADERASLAWQLREELAAGSDPEMGAAIRRIRVRMKLIEAA